MANDHVRVPLTAVPCECNPVEAEMGNLGQVGYPLSVATFASAVRCAELVDCSVQSAAVMTEFNIGIVGIGSYLPSRRVTNQDIERCVNTTAEWIVSRLVSAV